MPRAVVGRAFGAPDSYVLEPYDPGAPGEGEIRVAIKVSGVSFVDVLTARGGYQFKPALPFIPGSEYAGIVEAVGSGVAGFAPGDRVFGSSMGGTFAEAGNFSAAGAGRVPAGMALEQAAIFAVNYQTAHYALADRGRAQPGETLLVLGAAGGTGYAAVEVGKHLGLNVVASASSEDKRSLARGAGADAVVDAGAPAWREQVVAANHGRPVDIVFDPVGGESTERAFRTLGYGGRHLVIGFPAGVARLPTNLPLLKSASLVGVQLRDLALKRPRDAQANLAAVIAMAEAGKVRPAIAARFALERFAEAMRAAASGTLAGRAILTMG